MLSLVLKDLLIQKKVVLFSFFYVLIMVIAFQGQGAAMLIVGIVTVNYVMLQTACAYDEKNNTDIMLNSLPLSRGDIVLARYISVLVFSMIGIGGYVLITIIFGICNFPIKVYPFTLEAIFGAIAGIVIMNSIYLPTFYKLGYIKSKWINFILFFGVFFSIGGISYIIKQGNNIPIIKSIVASIEGFSESQIIIGLIMVMGMVILGSYFLSVKFYKNREF